MRWPWWGLSTVAGVTAGSIMFEYGDANGDNWIWWRSILAWAIFFVLLGIRDYAQWRLRLRRSQ